jgi:hypothetical protein
VGGYVWLDSFVFAWGGGANASYLWEVQYYGRVVSVFRGVGGDLCVYFRVVCGCTWVSE